jgi:hypothetical protein
MHWVGFEPTIPVFEQAKKVHSLDRMTTVIVGYSRSQNKYTKTHAPIVFSTSIIII